MKTNYRILFAFVLPLLLVLHSCSKFKGDVTVPAYLSIQSMKVVDDPSESLSYYEGFFSSEIDAAQIIVYFQGDTAETNLGVFQLPCKVPLLREGVAKYVHVYPVVKQNGIAATRIYYPYYTSASFENVAFASASVTSLGHIDVKYRKGVEVKWKEFFEPQSFSFLLDPDTVITTISDLDTVCSDYGCAAIRVPADKKSINFWIDEPVQLPSSQAYVYLEFDYMADIAFSVGFNNPNSTSDNTNIVRSMETITPSAHWQKMYVNMGKLWAWYNYYPYIRLYFTVLNESGESGNIYLDNMKVVYFY